MNKLPLISCICITSNRSRLLVKAISYFNYQNYPNRELVISFPKKDLLSSQVIYKFIEQNVNILPIEREEDESLGNSRNTAIIKCNGDYVCMWDDDDWHHRNRLLLQFNFLSKTSQRYQASILSQILLYDKLTEHSYASFLHTWEGTILCRKEILLQNQYANRNRGEDSHVISFLEKKNQLCHINDAAYLYIYIYHGKNTWDYNHFTYFTVKSYLLDKTSSKFIKDLVS